ncbi:MAG TPA: hypothetical protein VGQ38_15285 [Gaiellaceae bacterium]|nr:hypothetical protein [Gaiellaceae bacterium]
MKPNQALSPEMRAAIVAMKAAKPALTAPQIGKLVGVSAGSVSNVLRAARTQAVAAVQAEEAASAAEAEPVGPVTLQGVVERLRAEVPRLEAFAEQLRKAGDLRGWSAVTKQRTDLLDRLAEHEKPTGPAPDTDPANVAARDQLIRRIADSVAREEAGQRHAAALRGIVEANGGPR